MDVSTRVRAVEGVMATEVDGQAVLMHTERGVYYGLNEVGALVWRHMSRSVTIGELHDLVTAEFEVEPEACLRDIVALMERMEGEGLAEVASEEA
ncbi:MAG: PqqD family protein [bacterium]